MSKISSKNIKRLSVPQSPVVLAILDGWGYRKEISDNAIKNASTPIMDSLWHAYPHTLISASGSDVGLPDGQMGNSEVGHLTIGSGRIIQQELVRISNIVKNNQLGLINELKEMADSLKKNNSTLHITGLCSDGGVHSHIDHLLGLIKWASDNKLKKVAIHIITDGRDTPAKSASKYLNQIDSFRSFHYLCVTMIGCNNNTSAHFSSSINYLTYTFISVSYTHLTLPTSV